MGHKTVKIIHSKQVNSISLETFTSHDDKIYRQCSNNRRHFKDFDLSTYDIARYRISVKLAG